MKEVLYHSKIRELRARYNLSQAELGAQVGARRETISIIEKGTYDLRMSLANRIAKALNTSIDELFSFL